MRLSATTLSVTRAVFPSGPFGERGVQVTALCWHPQAPMLALGYRDGAVQLCRTEDGAVLPLLEPRGEPTTHLCFSATGSTLAALTDTGALARFALSLTD